MPSRKEGFVDSLTKPPQDTQLRGSVDSAQAGTATTDINNILTQRHKDVKAAVQFCSTNLEMSYSCQFRNVRFLYFTL